MKYIYPTKITWAEVNEIAGQERQSSDGTTATVTTRVTMRYRLDVTSKDRIYHNGRELGIVWHGDRDGFKRELTCDCNEVKA